MNDLQNFDKRGKPLDDTRLILSDTTDAGAQQYRIWRDAQQVLVPSGQSTTLKNQSENINMNTGVFGEIRKGYFNKPIVEFRNTSNYLLFDRFNLSIHREELPNDGTEIDIFGLNIIKLHIVLKVEFNGFIWNFPLDIRFYKESKNIFFSDTHFYTTANQPYHLQDFDYIIQFQGQFIINKQLSNSYLIDLFNSNNDNLYLDIPQCSIISGASEYIYNKSFNLNIPNINFSTDIKILIIEGWA
ncbi:MAG: hypothetical protein FWC41_00760 [Firmicutes bacterium]|nr:hypothetical protein [Bacillota bacterium]